LQVAARRLRVTLEVPELKWPESTRLRRVLPLMPLQRNWPEHSARNVAGVPSGGESRSRGSHAIRTRVRHPDAVLKTERSWSLLRPHPRQEPPPGTTQ
jgi:hypothetical protein